MTVRIAPSILSCDFARLGEEVRALTEAGADEIHVDVMDGHFVPNLTIGPIVVEAARRHTNLPLDVHLMVSNADLYLQDYAKAGASQIAVHVEASTHLHRSIQKIKSLGCRAAVAINPSTSLSSLDYILGDVDCVLIMTVNPGFGGQSFIPSGLSKIAELRQKISAQNIKCDIAVDGGIKADNAKKVAEAGANILISGSGIFGDKDYRRAISAIRAQATT